MLYGVKPLTAGETNHAKKEICTYEQTSGEGGGGVVVVLVVVVWCRAQESIYRSSGSTESLFFAVRFGQK